MPSHLAGMGCAPGMPGDRDLRGEVVEKDAALKGFSDFMRSEVADDGRYSGGDDVATLGAELSRYTRPGEHTKSNGKSTLFNGKIHYFD